MKILVKILLWTVAVVIGLPLLVLVLSPLWRRPWIEPLPGVRLTPARPVIAEKDLPPDSAFMRFRKAEAAFVKPGTNGIDEKKFKAESLKLFLVPWSEEAFPTMTKALAANEEALRLAREASVTPNAQVPTFLHLDDKADFLFTAMNMSWLLKASAARSLSQNLPAQALDDLLAAIRLGDMFTRGGPLIHRLVDIAITAVALSSARRLYLTSDVPSEAGESFIHDLRVIEQNMEAWPETYRWETLCIPEGVKRAYASNGLEEMSRMAGLFASGDVPETYTSLRPLALLAGSTPETTRKNMESVYAHLIKLAETPEDSEASENFNNALTAINKEEGARVFLKVKDPIGFLYANLFDSALTSINVGHVERLAALRATQVVIAIRQFQQANGRLPGSLGELVPQFLPSVPEDPFDHKPLRYIRRSDNAWAVYSVGRNRIDDGGKEPKSNSSADKRDADLVFSSTEAADALAKLNAGKNPR